ncbi:MAG: response regulator [Caldilineaceae bacterium]
MQQAGYAVAVARHGEEALTKLSSFQPDLVLLDVMLPGINGFDICQRIRQNTAWATMRIVMLSAKGRDVEIAKGLALGANAYITKPFSTKALLTEVQKQLGEVQGANDSGTTPDNDHSGERGADNANPANSSREQVTAEVSNQ